MAHAGACACSSITAAAAGAARGRQMSVAALYKVLASSPRSAALGSLASRPCRARLPTRILLTLLSSGRRCPCWCARMARCCRCCTATSRASRCKSVTACSFRPTRWSSSPPVPAAPGVRSSSRPPLPFPLCRRHLAYALHHALPSLSLPLHVCARALPPSQRARGAVVSLLVRRDGMIS